MTTLACGEPNGHVDAHHLRLEVGVLRAHRVPPTPSPRRRSGPGPGWRRTRRRAPRSSPCRPACPAGGSVRMTVPAATVSLASLCSVVTRPRAPSWLAAATEVVLATFGIETFGSPLDTVSLTTVLPATGPGAGSCESTSPTGRSDSTSVTWYGTFAWSSAALTSAICAPTKLPSVNGAFGGLKVSVMLPSVGHLGAGGRVLREDDVLGDRVVDLRRLRDLAHEAEVGEGLGGLVERLVRQLGHHDGGGRRRGRCP